MLGIGKVETTDVQDKALIETALYRGSKYSFMYDHNNPNKTLTSSFKS